MRVTEGRNVVLGERFAAFLNRIDVVNVGRELIASFVFAVRASVEYFGSEAAPLRGAVYR